jgi:hypothetical protein
MINFVDNTFNTAFPAPNCLGCAQFFYANQNIYRPEVCKHPLALLGSISQISSNATNIKDEICAMLNGGGGVLLFDCAKVDNLVIPRSGFIIEKEKEGI